MPVLTFGLDVFTHHIGIEVSRMPMSIPPINHFDYFTDIEEAFVRLRGKHLWLSPADWSLIQEWKEKGVPLQIVLRGIHKAFDTCTRRQGQHQINSLRYCKRVVEALYIEWLSNRVGEGASENEGNKEGQLRHEPALPFPRAIILAHLACCRSMLVQAALRWSENQNSISEVLSSAADKLLTIAQTFADDAAPAFPEYEAELDNLDGLIAEAIVWHFPLNQLAVMRSQAEARLHPHRGRMNPEDYKQAVNTVLIKFLRDELGIPQLSLFSL